MNSSIRAAGKPNLLHPSTVIQLQVTLLLIISHMDAGPVTRAAFVVIHLGPFCSAECRALRGKETAVGLDWSMTC